MSSLTIKFLVALMFSFAILLLATRSSAPARISRRLLTVIQDSVNAGAAGVDGDELKSTEERGITGRLGDLLGRFRFANDLKTLLVHADSSMSIGGTVLVSLGAGVGCWGLCFLLAAAPWLQIVAAALGSAVPYGVLRRKRDRRVKAFNTALPEAIDLMARSLRAGHSMGSAIEMVADQSPDPLGFEFVQVFQQQRLGLQFRDALLQMGARIPSRDLQFLITAILVQKETGGDLTEILDRASHVIRERVRIEGEVRTHTAQGRLTGWILSMLPIVMLLLINLVSPGYSAILFHDPVGQKLLYAGGTCIALGGLIIRKVVNVEV